MKYAEIWTFSDSYFPVYGQNHIHIFLYLDRIKDSVQIRENQIRFCQHMGKYGSEKALFQHISHSERTGVGC